MDGFFKRLFGLHLSHDGRDPGTRLGVSFETSLVDVVSLGLIFCVQVAPSLLALDLLSLVLLWVQDGVDTEEGAILCVCC